MVHQVLARKWRPRCFQEVIGQVSIIQTLSNALNQQYLHHAYLFTGTRGVGKTTLGRLLAKCLNCEKGITTNPCNICGSCKEIDSGRFPDLFEIDAASRTKVEDMRELLDNVQYAPAKGLFKVYLIDEVHMLSGHSFNALLKTLEEPPSHVKFIFATTEHHKLPITILSRCLQFHLTPLLPDQITAHCQSILQKEKIEFEKTALDLLARAANGSIRDALNLLDQGIAYGNGKVLTADMKSMLGITEPTLLFDILEALTRKKGNDLLRSINKLSQQGADFSNALSELLTLLHQIAMLQAVPDAQIENDHERLRQLANLLHSEDVQLFYQIGLSGQRDLPYSPNEQIGFEMTLLRMLAFYPESMLPVIQNKLSQHSRSSTHSSISSEEWYELLPQLNLTGAALALAQQCTLNQKTKTHLHFTLDPKQKPLLQKTQIQRIEEAVSKYFNRSISIKIDISKNSRDTPPSAITKKIALSRQMEAEKTILNDHHVQQIMKTFNATLVKEKILLHEEKT
ncbi:DNA polymerase III subunit gamma/tau [Coxiella endosymbiont of Rhipicephalus microplus]|uniref:DNA polymerase III subunit gamma/tau n=1 Tax=Coxiella endosymbiont of Rhipicephalus microplus TaxID=1656186 RepID=UPI000C7F7DAF|nr:DNA polymerase III subunit gamma/tau [Coxiella endosymbiont of Rhipicephalus microplus]